MQYERQLAYCSHCKFLGHTIKSCKRVNVVEAKEGVNKVKRLPRTLEEQNRTITNVQQTQEVDVGIHSEVAKALQIATLEAGSVPNSHKVVPLSNNHCDNIDATQYTEQT